MKMKDNHMNSRTERTSDVWRRRNRKAQYSCPRSQLQQEKYEMAVHFHPARTRFALEVSTLLARK